MHAQYQSLSRDFSRSTQELIIEHSIRPEDIMAVFLTLGGDHGQGACWLCFRALLTVKGAEIPYYKTKLIAEIYCKKEEGNILDESITPWLNKNLKQIKDSLLEVRSGSDGVTCGWRAKVLPPTNT